MDWDIWGLPLVVLGSSVVIGIFVAFRDEDKSIHQDKNSELQAQKDQIVEQIRELDADKDKMDVDVYQKLRESYLQDAEDVLEQMEFLNNNILQDNVVEKSELQERSEQKSVGWMTVVVTFAFFAILGALLGRYSKPRSDGEVMTGGSMDSRVTSVEQQLQAMDDAKKKRVADAQKVMETDADNIDAANTLTYEALLQRDFSSAMKYVEIVRSQQPKNPEMLVHLGILQMSIGMSDRAQDVFDTALQQDPNLGKAMLWKSVLLSNMGRTEEGLLLVKKSQTFLTLDEERFFAERLIEELDKPPPIITGRIEGNGTSPISTKGVLFVIARRAEQGGGPPVAVKRISNPTLPLSFELGKSDMVMGGEWPSQVWLSARLDEDGNAMTKDDTLLESSVIGPLEGEQKEIALQMKSSEQGLENGKTLPSTETNTTKTETKTKTEVVGAYKVKGRIVIEPRASQPEGVLFLIARATKIAKGPPVAVRKIENPTFPLDFSMNETHMMMGGEWPSQVWLSARLDGDGNAMTKTEQDWNSGVLGPIEEGGEPIQLMLKP
jgi:tetratricopeptide (TPR) repeat protein